ncbi:CCA tRNA nucleotidyltransferase [Halobacterium salinarum]|uniref:CCA tRNA nucleotidyltransferase n=1 Tax=Halobacterium salinarum TaxID=2242 RepID=UPI00255267CA|nr:CCA tRNA nucleotidyltransferase [Halobacterium salinarum]MDL0130851.1 CCA tRNA nucleotidyltransferase [Halobacterium salinarum]
MTDAAAVIERVRQRVDPTPAERRALAAAASRLTERAEAAIAELPVAADVVQVGSTARGTWVAGDRDIDLFVRFPSDLPREQLETYGTTVGAAVLPDGHEEYAEHPYVTGTFEGYAVDLVPCYDVAAATEIKSAVDRTPFHTTYLQEHLDDGLAADVRLCKQFLKGIGVYGSDLRTQGFSGYLCELLVVEYGGFEAMLAAIEDWQPPVVIDPAAHQQASFDDPLVVVDPTDPERNVAAVVSAANVATVQHHARRFRATPSEDAFTPASPAPLDAAALQSHIDRRDTTPLAVVLDAPDVVADQLYPQLYRSRDGVVRGLREHGFDVVRAAAWADERAVVFVELASAELPAVERHVGPPVSVGTHAERFYETYADDDGVYGPFVDDDGRYVVERDRDVRTAGGFARTELGTVALGARIESRVASGDYDVYVGDAVVEALLPEFESELAAYVDPKA